MLAYFIYSSRINRFVNFVLFQCIFLLQTPFLFSLTFPQIPVKFRQIKIKFPWLKNYLKQRFFEIQDELLEKNIDNPTYKLPKQYEIGKFIGYIEDWVSVNYKIIDDLEALESLRNDINHETPRRREFAYHMRKLKSKEGFEFVKELFNENIVKASIDDKFGVKNKPISPKILEFEEVRRLVL